MIYLVILILAAFLIAGVIMTVGGAGKHAPIGLGVAMVSGVALLIILILLLLGVVPAGHL